MLVETRKGWTRVRKVAVTFQGAASIFHYWFAGLIRARYFAGEIIGNLLELEPRRWRRPRRLDFGRNKERVASFKKRYDRFNWTGLIERSGR